MVGCVDLNDEESWPRWLRVASGRVVGFVIDAILLGLGVVWVVAPPGGDLSADLSRVGGWVLIVCAAATIVLQVLAGVRVRRERRGAIHSPDTDQ